MNANKHCMLLDMVTLLPFALCGDDDVAVDKCPFRVKFATDKYGNVNELNVTALHA
jgi:hypothetical protein